MLATRYSTAGWKFTRGLGNQVQEASFVSLSEERGSHPAERGEACGNQRGVMVSSTAWIVSFLFTWEYRRVPALRPSHNG